MTRTLCDTGPMVALLDSDDLHHARCVAALTAMPTGKLVTTWACLTEAMYLLGRWGGYPVQEMLWGYFEDGLIELHVSDQAEADRTRELMRQYADAPMDLADASLVAAAEKLGIRRVFTIDRHFRAYRLHGRQAFDVIP